MAKSVIVVDSICGSGKTSYVVQEINRNPNGGPYLYISPYLDEGGVEDFLKKVPAGSFVQPSDRGQSKSKHLRKLLASGENIASTHALFEELDGDAIELIRQNKYILIMDEVVDVLKHHPFNKRKIRALFKYDILREGEKITEGVSRIEDGDEDVFDEFDNLKTKARQNRLVLVNDALFFWLFPPEAFKAFRSITVLTYLYPGSTLACYFRCFGFTEERMTVEREVSTGELRLVPYDISAEFERRARIKELTTVYEMPNDKLYKLNGALSVTWYRNAKNENLKQLKNDAYNFLRHKVGAKADSVMWTTFLGDGDENQKEKNKKRVSPKSYSGAFVSCNLEAMNGLADRDTLVYMVNWFFNPTHMKFFEAFKVWMDEDLYAVGSLVQWFFRSAIRNDQPVTVWIPSARMRRLFQDWLDGKIESKPPL